MSSLEEIWAHALCSKVQPFCSSLRLIVELIPLQVRGSHQIALQSPAFRLPQTPVPCRAPSRTQSHSSNASQSSKRGPQNMAAAAAELANGLREFQTEKSTDGAPSQWPGLDSAVEEAVKVAEGHGLERQLLYHTAHAK
jgi:hypothetical protein